MRKTLITLIAALSGSIAAVGAMAADQSTRAADRAAADEAKLQKIIGGLTPGKPMSCLPLTRQNLSMTGVGSKLVYRAGRERVYVNDAPGCEGVARGDILVTVRPTGRTCRGDIAQTVDRVARFPTGNCALGDFTPYTAR